MQFPNGPIGVLVFSLYLCHELLLFFHIFCPQEASIALSTSYLLSHVGELERPYAVAITAYCLAVCLPDIEGAKPAWKQLQTLAATGRSINKMSVLEDTNTVFTLKQCSH